METEASQLPDDLRIIYKAGVERGRQLAAAEIKALRVEIATLRAENADLRCRLAGREVVMNTQRVRAQMNSSNSSLAPSSDRPIERERLRHDRQVKQSDGKSAGNDRPKCHKRIRGKVPKSHFGAGMITYVATLHGVLHAGNREIARFLDSWLAQDADQSRRDCRLV